MEKDFLQISEMKICETSRFVCNVQYACTASETTQATV